MAIPLLVLSLGARGSPYFSGGLAFKNNHARCPIALAFLLLGDQLIEPFMPVNVYKDGLAQLSHLQQPASAPRATLSS
jgi:hypothetical protein